ncbi:PREDICTED: N-acetyllactosaminide beta-1,3-N-acetylglucosaminyltransferase 3-like [Nanorana parkeri]|uniref:N-acetyllactosaminide beta-1,3-N-acetylglucosaminyltransferase 3-like n=1 Tax=Nanorana parkeri TaxID=125878 RepID=UPI0008546B7C|nr:PREDICTED: N-acetyllactosaminide beta-1,3-N-acetylglucosaminyltransferase 3-like [Nanorana parkeri]
MSLDRWDAVMWGSESVSLCYIEVSASLEVYEGDECMVRRRRLAITILSVSLCFTLSLLSWNIYENEPIFDLPDLHHPFPANLSAPPSLRRSATLYDRNFSFFLNLSEYSRMYPGLQDYRCRAVIGLDDYCQTREPLILLAVKSHPTGRDRRDSLRRTWARGGKLGGYHLKRVFLVANSGFRRQMERLVEEAAQHEDIILWDFMESHHNLSLKERCFLEWLYYRCADATYIFKGDDDEFVNPHALVSYISSSPREYRLRIHGQLQIHAPPERWGKYAVPLSVYPHGYYPPFVSGGGFLLPSELVPSLYWAAATIPIFPLDDVFFGFLALAAKVTFHHEPRFRSFGLKNDHACRYADVLVAHGLTPKRLLALWQELPHLKPCPPELYEKDKEEEKMIHSFLSQPKVVMEILRCVRSLNSRFTHSYHNPRWSWRSFDVCVASILDSLIPIPSQGGHGDPSMCAEHQF